MEPHRSIEEKEIYLKNKWTIKTFLMTDLSLRVSCEEKHKIFYGFPGLNCKTQPQVAGTFCNVTKAFRNLRERFAMLQKPAAICVSVLQSCKSLPQFAGTFCNAAKAFRNLRERFAKLQKPSAICGMFLQITKGF